MVSAFEHLFGAFFAESFIAFMLYGVVGVQAFTYALRAATDPARVKVISIVIWLLETMQTAFLIHVIYYYAVQHHGDASKAQFIVWSIPAVIATEGAVVLVVQGYCLLRIWVFSNRSILLVSVIAILLCARIVFNLAFLFCYTHIHSWETLYKSKLATAMVISTLSLSIATDIPISVAFTYYLLRDRTGFRSTDSVVQALVKFTVNTGAVTASCSIVMLFTYVFLKDSLMSPGFVAINSKLYANSFFAILNASHKLRERAALIGNYPAVNADPSRMTTSTKLQYFHRQLEVLDDHELNDRPTEPIPMDAGPFDAPVKYHSDLHM